MIEHHPVEQQKQVVSCEEAVVKAISHLTRGEVGDGQQRGKHYAARKAGGGGEQ